jgi:acyl-coenzyme A synthetase/AMP-(fatty) acid ligase
MGSHLSGQFGHGHRAQQGRTAPAHRLRDGVPVETLCLALLCHPDRARTCTASVISSLATSAKVPSRFVFTVADFPRTVTGKILKQTLRSGLAGPEVPRD